MCSAVNAIVDENLLQDLLQDLLSLFDANDFTTCFATLNKAKQLVMQIPSHKNK